MIGRAVGLAVATLAFAAAFTAPARADFSVIRFENGYCQIWWDSGATPWGVGWTKIAIGLPDIAAARIALDSAIAQRACR